MKKLVTGGNGLVGSHFSNHWLKPASSLLNLTDREATIAYFKNEQPQVVVHAAAKVGGLYSNMQMPATYFEQNVRMNSNVLEACYAAGVKRLVAFLSTCIFPDAVEYPLTEEKIHGGPPHPSNFGYAYAKRMQDVAIQAHNLQYGTNYFCVVPTNIYGLHDNFNLQHAHVIPALIHKVYLARQQGAALQVPGNGSALREFIFAGDVAAIVEQLLEQYHQTTPLIISTGQEISIKEVLEMIVDLMQFKGRIEWQTHLPNGQHRKPTDIDKLKDVLPQLKFTDIYSGLKETIEWFEEHYPAVRR